MQLVAERTNTDVIRVLNWERQADLMRVHGVCGDDACLLDAAGVHTPADLAAADGDLLLPRLQQLLARFGVGDVDIAASTVSGWITAAGSVR